ncbi:MAG: SUMF1/EgtB/PvdO family nonheme iron enzyme [Candidatus Competibacteraceae bacterium]|nr:SUMF1/EgtB/PvdO family nonheme iron enzyme [Candidatus Competibacteraceae bacterium]
MDLEKRREELEQTRAGERSDDEQRTRPWEGGTPRETTAAGEPATPTAELLTGGGGQTKPEPGAPSEETRLEALESGKVIGPFEHRVRLLHDLGGNRRIWLVLAVAPTTERARGIADEFRAIKLFLPPNLGLAPREAGRDERSQRADLIGSRAYLAKIRSRVEQAIKLDHSHIARVYGWHQGSDGWAFAEMEYIDHQSSQSLAKLLCDQGQSGLPWDVVLKWLQPVAAALDHARQEQHIGHQDVDADKIFLTQTGLVKLVGFGLATEVREPCSVLFGSGAPGKDSNAEGSIDSVPAETAFRRDVFALALLVYQMLMGHSAHEAKTEAAHTIPRPSGLTDEAWRILRRGLAYPSELCPTEAGKFMAALEEAQRPAEKAGRGWNALKWGWLAGAGLLLLAALGIYGLTEREDQAQGTVRPVRTEPPTDAPATPVQEPDAPPDVGLTALLQEAEREADLRAFESAKRVDTVVAYQLYLQRCPRCGFRQEARSAIQNLEAEEKISKLKIDFETLARALERENHDERADEALARLNSLAALTPGDPFVAAGRRRIALAWVARAQASANKGDLAGARHALKKASSIQPDLLELTGLEAGLTQAEVTERAKQDDTESFADARRGNTRKAYWTYLEKCAANCNHRAEAEAALVRLGPSNPVMRDRLGDGSQGPELVVIPAGGFEMGSPSGEKGRYNDEQPHPARIAKTFAIGKYEVMFFEYDRFAAATGRALPNDQGWGRGRRPVINVSWQEAKDYTEWLSQQTGHRYRLPTETEWEYAARAGTAASRYWGDDPNQGCFYGNAADLDGKKVFVGWTTMQCRDGYIYTAPAGSYRNNDYGLHDMLGNVLEWTCSLYAQDYRAPSQSCEEPESERQFVVRGGSWNDEPRNVRSADRHRNRPDFRDYYLGFRVVRELR